MENHSTLVALCASFILGALSVHRDSWNVHHVLQTSYHWIFSCGLTWNPWRTITDREALLHPLPQQYDACALVSRVVSTCVSNTIDTSFKSYCNECIQFYYVPYVCVPYGFVSILPQLATLYHLLVGEYIQWFLSLFMLLVQVVGVVI
jgi:hypothetical protein